MKRYIWSVCGLILVCGCNDEIASDVSHIGQEKEACNCEPVQVVDCQVKSEIITFEDICLYSGGKLNIDGYCLCEAELCPEGVVCISDMHNKPACAVKRIESVCEEGARRCLDDRVFGCVGGQWEAVEQCGADKPSCVDGRCVVCVEGSTKCTDEKESVCQEGKWTVTKECDFNLGCYENKYCNECEYGFDTPNGIANVGIDRCMDEHTLGVCKSGKLYPQVCENEGLCRYDRKLEKNVCMECSEENLDAKRDFNKIQVCMDGVWGPPVKCEHSVADGPVCQTCSGNKTYCFKDAVLEDEIMGYTCENSFWVMKQIEVVGDCDAIYVKANK